MSKLKVRCFSVSLDGFSAGPNQDKDNPVGVRGTEIFQWFFETRTWRKMHGTDGGATGIDDDYAQKSFDNMGAWIMGRNMFGPIRGPWPDDSWKGWWGEDPPYHTPVFVLTNHAREPITMKGGTTFHFVTDGIHRALELAVNAANGKDVRLGGGVATVRQYLLAGLLDEMQLVYSPVILGSGENLLAGINLPALGYHLAEHKTTENTTHVTIKKKD